MTTADERERAQLVAKYTSMIVAARTRLLDVPRRIPGLTVDQVRILDSLIRDELISVASDVVPQAGAPLLEAVWAQWAPLVTDPDSAPPTEKIHD